jgi:hypothetical protein
MQLLPALDLGYETQHDSIQKGESYVLKRAVLERILDHIVSPKLV